MARTRTKFPHVEPAGTGFRATLSVDGRLRKGKVRRTAAEAYEDAKNLKRLRDVGLTSGLTVTLDQVCEQVLDLCDRRKRREGTRAFYACHFETLKRAFGKATRLSSIDARTIQKHVDARTKAGIAPATIRNEITCLRRCFNVARLPPATNDTAVSLPDLAPKPIDVFEWADVLKILAKIRAENPFEAAVVGLFFYTGIRRSEAARIRIIDDENDIDFGRKVLHVRIGKRRPRSIPCPPKLMDLLSVFVDRDLRPMREIEGDGLLPGSIQKDRANYVSKVFLRWAAKLKDRRLHAHAARHSFGSRLAELGVSVQTVARLMGHDLKRDAITHLYVTPHDPELREAMGRLWKPATKTA